MMERQKIGIIGGNGKMGRWFQRLFSQHGHDVLVSDAGTGLSNEDIVKACDIVMFSVPLAAAAEIIEEAARFSRKGQLFMDVTSIKGPAVAAMLKSEAEVLGMHPMFSHAADNAEGQLFILCEARLDRWKGWMDAIIEKEKGVIKRTTPEKHDLMMAVIQGFTHFSLISMGHAFRELGLDVKESLEFSSPIYRIRLDMVGRILNQDPEMYADISILNPHSHEVMRQYIQSVMKLYLIIKDNEKEDFIRYFNDAALFMGGFREQAMDESQLMIDALCHGKK